MQSFGLSSQARCRTPKFLSRASRSNKTSLYHVIILNNKQSYRTATFCHWQRYLLLKSALLHKTLAFNENLEYQSLCFYISFSGAFKNAGSKQHSFMISYSKNYVRKSILALFSMFIYILAPI